MTTSIELNTLRYEVRDGVALVTLNRADRMNAIGGGYEGRSASRLLRAGA